MGRPEFSKGTVSIESEGSVQAIRNGLYHVRWTLSDNDPLAAGESYIWTVEPQDLWDGIYENMEVVQVQLGLVENPDATTGTIDVDLMDMSDDMPRATIKRSYSGSNLSWMGTGFRDESALSSTAPVSKEGLREALTNMETQSGLHLELTNNTDVVWEEVQNCLVSVLVRETPGIPE